MTASVGHLLGRRRRDPKPAPMAVPLNPDAHTPLGVRFADWLHGIVTRRLSASGQRVLSWTLLALCLGALGVAYLLQTSYVASLATQRARLESTTTAIQDSSARLTAQVAEARAIGKAEPAAREQGLRLAPASAVAYLTVPDITEPTAVPTPISTATLASVARVRASLLGQASADAPSPAPVGAAATREATTHPATLNNATSNVSATVMPPATKPTGGKP